MKFSTPFALVSAAMFAAGCADTYPPATTYSSSDQVISSPKYGTASTSSYAESDREVEARIRHGLQSATFGKDATVSSQKGTVTLTGTVPTETERQAVETLVRNTTGVQSVIDQLQVTAATGQPTYSYGNQQQNTYSYQQNTANMDQALAERVRDVLRSNPSSGGLAQIINVSAQNGAVTLTGTVPNDQERLVVDNLVRNVSGVTSVFDQMQIAAPPTGRNDQQNYSYNQQQPQTYNQQQYKQQQGYSQDYGQQSSASAMLATGDIFNLHVQGLNDTDRNLAQNILQGLHTDAILLSLLPTVNINVSAGRVILNGTVQNEQQRQAIASVVQQAAGANNVENRLQVMGH